MARLDYYDIELEIKDVLESDSDIKEITVIVEDAPEFAEAIAPWIGIYLESREAPSSLQKLSAGTITEFRLRFSIWAWTYSLESIESAIKARDELLGKIEIALMKARSTRDKLQASWIEGGEMLTARIKSDAGQGFMSGAEVIFVLEAKTSY